MLCNYDAGTPGSCYGTAWSRGGGGGLNSKMPTACQGSNHCSTTGVTGIGAKFGHVQAPGRSRAAFICCAICMIVRETPTKRAYASNVTSLRATVLVVKSVVAKAIETRLGQNGTGSSCYLGGDIIYYGGLDISCDNIHNLDANFARCAAVARIWSLGSSAVAAATGSGHNVCSGKIPMKQENLYVNCRWQQR